MCYFDNLCLKVYLCYKYYKDIIHVLTDACEMNGTVTCVHEMTNYIKRKLKCITMIRFR